MRYLLLVGLVGLVGFVNAQTNIYNNTKFRKGVWISEMPIRPAADRVVVTDYSGRLYTQDLSDFVMRVDSAYTSVTKSQLDSLININALKGSYLVQGVDPSLYGGTDVYITALNGHTISSNGYGIFYNPKYDQSIIGFGIFPEDSTFSIGDTTIWGGKHWINLNGNSGSAVDALNLDSEWEVIPFDNVSYNIAIDEIKYDYENDRIIYRNEKNSNIVSTSYANISMWEEEQFGEINHPIKAFQWGNLHDFDNQIGIGNQIINNSLNENLNFRGSYQYNLTFDNVSHQTYLIFDNNSSQMNLTFDNESSQSNLSFDNNSAQSNLSFDKNSYQSNLTFDNVSRQTYLIFDNGSRQQNLTETTGKTQQRIKFDNYRFDRISTPMVGDEEDLYYTNYVTVP